MKGIRFDSLIAFLDNLPFRKARVKGLNKESTVYVIYPYGLTANVPEGALCVSWQIGGQESDRAAIADFPQNRPKNLEPGEVVVSNYLTGSEIRFKADGTIIATSDKFIFNSDVDINGDVTIVGTSVTHNGDNIGDTHIHSQGNDGAGDTEVDTGTPHS